MGPHTELLIDPTPSCERCGTTVEVTFAPDPYSEEINFDDTPHWMCATCRRESAQDI